MEQYLNKTLHKEIQVNEYSQIDKLPLALRKKYVFSLVRVDLCEFLVIESSNTFSLTEMRKIHKQIENISGYPCAFYASYLNYYAKDKCIENGIGFIIENKEIYLPFLFVSINTLDKRSVPYCEKISFLTQKMVLIGLYNGWKNMNVSKVAEDLNVTKTSISRCFDELEALKFPYLVIKNRGRCLHFDEDRKKEWDSIKKILRNPVIKTIKLKKKISSNQTLGGLSALEHYSLIEDNQKETYIVLKKDIKSQNIQSNISSYEEDYACIVQEVGYKIDFKDGKAIDPLSLVLSLTNEEKGDSRISLAIDEMLEEYIWLED